MFIRVICLIVLPYNMYNVLGINKMYVVLTLFT